jgi:hypothetical protein
MNHRGEVPVHSKRPNRKGQTKDKNHGTRSWTTWISEKRMDSPHFFTRNGRSRPKH